MSFGRVRFFGSEVERIIGRMHEFTLYKPVDTVLESYFYSRERVHTTNIYSGLYGFIQPRYTLDERYDVKGIVEMGSFIGHFKSSYTTTRGTVTVEQGDRVYWDGNYMKVSTITNPKDGRGDSITRASMELVVGE